MKYDKKRKPRGMKHKIHKKKKREQRIGLAVTVAVLIVIISVSGFLIYSMLTSSPQEQETGSTSEPKAAIVDHLSLTAPNQTFIQTATNILKQAGYTVDYYPGEEVTVEFYRNLPNRGYELVILRVHTTPSGVFFTSEAYSTSSYVWEQLNERVWKVSYFHLEPPFYFGIPPSFVKSHMNGRFEDTIIIAMGCYTLKLNDMAEAFTEKGARVYIGWNESVSASHTDRATTYLLKQLISEKQTIKKAVDNTMKEIGVDPAYNSQLIYYPLEAEDYTIQNFLGNIITHNTTENKYQASHSRIHSF